MVYRVLTWLDGTWLDHDAARIIIFLGIAGVLLIRKRKGWAAFSLLMAIWVLWDHCVPLRRWVLAH